MDQTINATEDFTNKSSRFLFVLFIVEMWERFSYYGMRALLILFLTSQLGFSDPKAYALYSVFAALGYSGPVLGGILADKFFGFFNMVLIGSIVIAVGHLSLVCIDIDSGLIYYGLGLIAIGTGLFKGNITSILGLCYKNNDPNREKGFTLFYVSVNVGSSTSALATGYIAYKYGWHFGFALAGIGMLLGLITYIKFSQYPINRVKFKHPKYEFNTVQSWKIVMVTILILLLGLPIAKLLMHSEKLGSLLQYFGIIAIAPLVYIIIKSEPKQRHNFIVMGLLIIFLMLFFALEMQLGSLFNLFVERNVDKNILGFMVPSSFSQAISPSVIVFLGPLIAKMGKINKNYAVEKFSFGILMMALCFFILYLGCSNANLVHLVDYYYVVLGIGVIGLGELCIAPFTQSQVSALSPKNLKGFMMGILMLGLSFSNLAGIVISKFVSVPTMQKFDASVSLNIYKNAFFKISMFNIGLFLIFLIFIPYIKAVLKRNTESNNDIIL